jgi:predicted NBD/HSP70 family sugar kinase
VKEKDDVARAAEGVTEAKRKLAELEDEVRAEIANLETAHDPAALVVAVEEIKPRKADTATVRIALAWRAG